MAEAVPQDAATIQMDWIDAEDSEISDQVESLIERLKADKSAIDSDRDTYFSTMAALENTDLIKYEVFRNQIAQITGFKKRTLDKIVKSYYKEQHTETSDNKEVINGYIKKWIEDYHIKYIQDTKRFYLYSDGVYVNFDKDFIGFKLQQALGNLITNSVVEEAMGVIRRSAVTHLEPSDFNPPLICLENCVLDIDTMSTYQHSPDWWFVNKLPVKYDPQADCPAIKQFFSEVLNPADIPLIEEIFGWVLWKYDYRPHRAVMLHGKGRNGKGTTLRLIEALLGSPNVSHISLEQLTSFRFAPALLVDKSANLFGDTHSKDMSDTAIFKCATGEDTFSVEEKFKTPFNYRNYAKMVFAANKLPKTPDNTNGFYSRWMILDFPNRFDIDPGKMDHDLISKLTTPEELSGLLNLAIAGLNRLRANNWTFSYRLTTEDVRFMYQRLSDPVFAFLEDTCQQSDGYITKTDLFSTYKKYAMDNTLAVMSPKKFGQAVEENILIPVDSGYSDKDTRVWRGISWKQ